MLWFTKSKKLKQLLLQEYLVEMAAIGMDTYILTESEVAKTGKPVPETDPRRIAIKEKIKAVESKIMELFD